MVNATCRTRSVCQNKYQWLVIRRGHKRAIIALGQEFLKTVFILLVFILLSRKESHLDSTVDHGELPVMRIAPHWTAALRQYILVAAAT